MDVNRIHILKRTEESKMGALLLIGIIFFIGYASAVEEQRTGWIKRMADENYNDMADIMNKQAGREVMKKKKIR